MLVFNTDFCLSDIPLKNLIHFAETRAITTSIVKEYIVTALVEDENILSLLCEEAQNIGDSLKSVALADLEKLWGKLHVDTLSDYVPTLKRKLPFHEYEQSLMRLVSSVNAKELLDRLILHYSTYGAGANAKYIAFKWDNGLTGINNPDNILLEELFCLDSQKKELACNTVSFLNGLPSHNAILYGCRGSGKSSMVKAILNEYYKEGLRIVEISKEFLPALPRLIDSIKNKKFHYIIFLDDLSFEYNEVEYKNLKVMLEGQIEKQPNNVLFYATSNRRHLINETWAERAGDEIHVNDTLNEKLSLAERFGLCLYFSPLNQTEYIMIVEKMLSLNGILLSDKIRADAIKWSISRGCRSGRAATQFVKMLLSSQ